MFVPVSSQARTCVMGSNISVGALFILMLAKLKPVWCGWINYIPDDVIVLGISLSSNSNKIKKVGMRSFLLEDINQSYTFFKVDGRLLNENITMLIKILKWLLMNHRLELTLSPGGRGPRYCSSHCYRTILFVPVYKYQYMSISKVTCLSYSREKL